MAHWDNNLTNISLNKMVSRGQYEAFRRYIEKGMTGEWMSLLYILDQGGSVLFYNAGFLLIHN